MRHLTLRTTLTPDYLAGATEGRLALTIAGDGSITGTYRDSDGRQTQVTGGLTAARIWLDFGDGRADASPAQVRPGSVIDMSSRGGTRRMHVIGTLVDGTIDGTTVVDEQTWRLKAVQI